MRQRISDLRAHQFLPITVIGFLHQSAGFFMKIQVLSKAFVC